MSACLHSYPGPVKCVLLSFSRKCKRAPMGKKKVFSTRVDEARIKDLKHLAVDEDRSLGDLLEEAVQDLLKKYGKKGKK